MEVREWTNKFGRSMVNKWLGGVCGGLEAGTGIPAWLWRLMFLLLVCFFGTGIILYLILWIVLPPHRFSEQETQGFSKGGNLGFKRVQEGSWIAGICSGLGVATRMPAWIYRLIFLLLAVATFSGVVLYIFLWLSVPKGTDAA